MPKVTATPDSDELTYDELSPRVDFAAYYRTSGHHLFSYVVPAQHWILIDEGALQVLTPQGLVTGKPGDLLCVRRLPGNEMHWVGPGAYFEMHLWLVPPPRGHLPLVIGKRPLTGVIALGGRRGEARSAFMELCSSIDQADEASRLRTQAALWSLIAIAASSVTGPRRQAPAEDPWKRLARALSSQLDRHLTINDFSAALGLTTHGVIRGFQRRFGVTPMAYRKQIRLRWAAASLVGGHRSIKEVAMASGFDDPAAFARAFRQAFGISPTAARSEGRIPEQPSRIPDLPFVVNRHIRPPEAPVGDFGWLS